MANSQFNTSIEYREISRISGYRFGNDGSVWTRWKSKRVSGEGSRSGFRYILGDQWRRQDTSRMKSGHFRTSIKGHGTPLVHRLILEAFKGYCPDGMECRHLDGNPANNRLENLVWGSRSENVRDSMRHGTAACLRMKGEFHPMVKLNKAQVLEIRRLAAIGMTFTSIALQFGITRTTAGEIATGVTWKHIPGVLTETEADKHKHHCQARGDRIARAKLTEDDVRIIRLKQKAGSTIAALAKEFNVCTRNIRDIINGMRWKHVQ